MKKVFLSFLALFMVATTLSAKSEQNTEKIKSEQRVLNDLLARINDKALNKEIRLLSRVNKCDFHPFKYSANFKNNKLEPTEADQKNGFVAFIASSESKVPHNYNPSQEEINAKMILFGARKSTTAGYFGFVPLKEGEGDAFLKVSELKNEAGDVFDPAAIKLFMVNHLFMTVSGMAYNYYPEPHGLEPITSATPIKLRDGVSDSIYIEVKIPQYAKPGTYVGELEFAANGITVKKPIELTVYDFEIPKLPLGQMNWGFFSFTNVDTHINHFYFMSEHGLNTLSAPVSSDNALNEKYIKKLRSGGIDGEILYSIAGTFSSIAARNNKRYSEAWARDFGQMIKNFNSFMLSIGETNDRWAGLVYDEPRETMPNPWNISYAETIIYLDLIGQYAPGLRRTVNPTSPGPKEAFAKLGDRTKTAFPDGVYASFITLPNKIELLNIHYARNSAGLAKFAREKNMDMWGFSDGDSRYAWGLQNFKIGTKARFIYAYSARPSYAPTPLHPIQMSGYEFPGRAATPPYALPFSDDVIWSTCKLKNMRDGITDYHYFYLLDQLVKAKPNDPVAIEAKQYMTDLLNQMPEYASDFTNISEYEVGTSEDGSMGMDIIRRKLADYIVKLK